jgi:hypothetical protein
MPADDHKVALPVLAFGHLSRAIVGGPPVDVDVRLLVHDILVSLPVPPQAPQVFSLPSLLVTLPVPWQKWHVTSGKLVTSGAGAATSAATGAIVDRLGVVAAGTDSARTGHVIAPL